MSEVTLRVRVQPRARRNALQWVAPGRVKVWLTVPPVEGRANAALLRLLADALGVAPSTLALVRGDLGREKLVRISGLSPAMADARLREAS